MRGTVAIALAVLFALPASAQAADPPFVDWTSLLPGAPGQFQPSRERDCVSGKPSCVEGTLDEMYRRFDRLYATCDHNAAFGITYIRVTEAIRTKMLQRPPFYEEPRFLQHVDKVFARMYFRAYDAWRSGDRERVPLAWREAFDAGRDRSVGGIGNLLMSMNAHINRDFPYLVEALGMTKPGGGTRKVDHDRGNRVLNPLYDDVLRELAARFDRSILNYDVPGVVADDTAFFQILQGWREGVWRNAELLRAARTPTQRRLVSNTIEQYALTQARLIRSGSTIRSSAARDAQCAQYQRTHRERGGKAAPVAGRGLRASRRGFVRIRVRCPRGLRDCHGFLRLADRRGRAMARGKKLALARGTSRVYRLRLGPRNRVRLRRGARLRARAVARTRSPWGTVRSASRVTRIRG
jgi:hypothetical protein